MLRSRLNNLTQTYTFNHHTSNTDAFNSSAMPTLLDLTTDLPSHTLEVVMEPCRYQGDTTSSETGLGRTYFARGLQFYKVFMLQSNLSVHESILYIVPPSNGHSEDETVANVTWTRIFRPRKDVRVANSDEMHNFIVPEGIEAMNKPISNLASPALESDEEESASRAPRLVDHRLVYDALTRKHDGGEIRATTIDVPTVTAQVRDSIVESANSSPPPLGTM
jgi:RNA polymerase I-specific transcription initiation factor RRN6